MSDQGMIEITARREPWNKGRLIGQKRPLRPKDVWAIRVRLQIGGFVRDLALFNLAVDSKLRACDLVALRINDVEAGGRIRERATVVQRKTGRPVQFEITEPTRAALRDWLATPGRRPSGYLFLSRFRRNPHLSTLQRATAHSRAIPSARRSIEETQHLGSDLRAKLLKREVTRVEEMELQVREIAFVGMSAFVGEDAIVLAPHQKSGFQWR
jgi:integrase